MIVEDIFLITYLSEIKVTLPNNHNDQNDYSLQKNIYQHLSNAPMKHMIGASN